MFHLTPLKQPSAIRTKKILAALCHAAFAFLTLHAPAGHAQSESDANSFPMPTVASPPPVANPTFGDVIDPYSGKLSVVHTDLILPGNGGLDIKVQRAYAPAYAGVPTRGLFVFYWDPVNEYLDSAFIEGYPAAQHLLIGRDWGLHFGRLRVRLENSSRKTICAQPYSSTYAGTAGIGPVLQLPDGREEQFYKAKTNALPDVAAESFVSPSNYRLECSEGVLRSNGTRDFGTATVRAPDSTAYTLSVPVYIGLFGNVTTESTYDLLPSKITDRHGNSLSFTYGSVQGETVLKRIDGSDGRVVEFVYQSYLAYTDNTDNWIYHPVLSEIKANGRSWKYAYTYPTINTSRGKAAVPRLDKVTGPESQIWSYRYHPHYTYANLPPDATQEQAFAVIAASQRLKSMTSPYGGTVEYKYALTYPAVPVTNGSTTRNYVYGVVASRAESTGGTWAYKFTPASALGELNTTVVTAPDGTTTYKHYGINSVDRTEHWKHGRLVSVDKGGAETTTFSWATDRISDDNVLVHPFETNWIDKKYTPVAGVYRPRLTEQKIQRQSELFVTTYSDVDGFGNPGTVTESRGTTSTALTAQKRTAISYFSNTASEKWIIGLTKNKSVADLITTGNPSFSISRTIDTASGRVLSENRFGQTTEFTYTSQGDLKTVTDANTHVTAYDLYKRGIAGKVTFADGNILSREIDDDGAITAETRPNGKAYRYAYDGLKRLTRIDYPRGSPTTTTYNFDSANRLQKTTARDSSVSTETFDGVGRVIEKKNADIVTTFKYDAIGRTVFQSYPNSAFGVAMEYDILGRPKKITHQTSTTTGSSKEYTYDGVKVRVKDERDLYTTLSFQAFGNPNAAPLVEIDPESLTAAKLTIGRDILGRIRSFAQGGYTRSYSYSAANCLASESHPETGVTNYGRDAVCNILWKEVGPAARINYGYDNANRLTSISYPGTTPGEVFTYSATGKVKTATYGTGTNAVAHTYEFDDNDNMISDTLTLDNKSFVTAYRYDGRDKPSAIVYPMTNATVIYELDALARATKVSVTSATGATQSLISEIAYHASGLPSSFTYANGVKVVQTQNSRLWAESINYSTTSSTIAALGYSYDNAGNIISIQDSLTNYSLSGLGYDALERLTNINGSTSCDICYDAAGNITKMNLWGQTKSLGYDNKNRLASVSGSVSNSFAYDARGNTTSNGKFSFAYDEASNLTSVTQQSTGTPVATYFYGSGNSRVKTQLHGKKPVYSIRGISGQLLLEYNSNTDTATEYFYLRGQQIAKRTMSSVTGDVGQSQMEVVDSGVTPAGQTPTITVNLPQAATGSVSFTVDGVVVGSSAVSAGQAKIDVPGLSAGCHQVTASYSGDTNFTAMTATGTVCVTETAAGPIQLTPIINYLLEDNF